MQQYHIQQQKGGAAMPLLQVRDIPNDLYETLSKTARMENRSIAQQTVVLLRAALNLREERAFRRKAIFQEIDAMKLNNPDQFPDPADLLREDRDR
ncbi:MAG: hypothetical protein LBT65_06880 [Synergistaceae bacterium]|jgi:hypothetical protein|nr:hypothetical protein [Synergistaceae bacterium]